MILRRSSEDRVIAGVCGGLAKFFSIDSKKIRIAFILMILFGGLSLISYIIAWIIIPESNIR
jgi:phage shock protein C